MRPGAWLVRDALPHPRAPPQTPGARPPPAAAATQGRQEFTPPPSETKAMIRSSYAVRRNLLLRFSDDTIDETLPLAVLLQARGRVGGVFCLESGLL